MAPVRLRIAPASEVMACCQELKTLARVLALALLLSLVNLTPASAAGATITVTSPSDYQVVQRNGANRASIVIRGRYTGNPKAIQARWKFGPWTTIDTTLTRGSGTFRGVLTRQAAGQGPLHVRFSNLPGLIDTVTYVGIGDIFVMAGQSNMSGRGTSRHRYTPTKIRAALFGNNDRWGGLTDPYDSPVGQVDRVSRDNYGTPMGSWVALFANAHIRRTGVPVAFIPAAFGGSPMARWSRSSSRTTLYGSMWRRVRVTGGRAKAVLWFQGENDSNTSAGTYRRLLNTFANNVSNDFGGAPTIPAVIGSAPYPGVHRAGVRMGTLLAVNDNRKILMGPSFYDVNIDDEGGDGLHFKSNRDLSIVGRRFWAAVNEAFYGSSNGIGPRLAGATVANGVIRLEFDSALGTVTADAKSFWVMAGATRIPVQSVTVEDDTIVLQLSVAPPDGVTVSLGHDNRSGVDHAVYDRAGLPAVPFLNRKPDRQNLI